MSETKSIRKDYDNRLNVWEKQPFETPKQYNSFCIYRNTPIVRRSLVKIFRDNTNKVLDKENVKKVDKGGNLVIHKHLATDWSARNDWVYRTNAHDIYIERQYRKEMERHILKLKKRQLKVGITMENISKIKFQSLDRDLKRLAKDKNLTGIEEKVPIAEALKLNEEGVKQQMFGADYIEKKESKVELDLEQAKDSSLGEDLELNEEQSTKMAEVIAEVMDKG